MDPQEVFDKFLRHKDIDAAFNYVAEKLAWDPESIHLRGMTAFSFRLREQYAMARFLAEEVLKEEPGEEWALATVFSTTNNLDVAFAQFSFFKEKEFRLSPVWIARFKCLGQPDEARKMIYCLSRYGSPRQKAQLSEDWLVNKVSEKPDDKQLELGLVPSEEQVKGLGQKRGRRKGD
jgi:hypothetical protein